MNENNFLTPTAQNSNFNLSGGLNLGSVNIVHVVDTRSAIKAAAIILLIWFGFSVGLEIIKYLISK